MARTLALMLTALAARAAAADFEPNLTFQVTLPVLNPLMLYKGFAPAYRDSAQSVLAGEDPTTMYMAGSTSANEMSAAWLQFYGTDLTVNGAATAESRMSFENRTVRSASPDALYALRNLSWGFNDVGFFSLGSEQPAQITNFTFTTGMKTQARSFENVSTLVVPFAENGTITNSSYISCPWSKYDIEIVPQTPVNGSQGAQRGDAVRIPNYQFANPVVITPPVNTAYIMLNMTMSSDSHTYYVVADPPLPGRAKDQMTMMYLYSGEYPLSNVRAFESPLDPDVHYRISVFPNSNLVENPTFNSVTFYNALLNGFNTRTGGDQPTLSSPPLRDSGEGHKTNAGAIAGGVVGGIVGVALIAILGFLFIRRRRNKERALSEPKFDVDESHLHGAPLVTPFTTTPNYKHEASTLLSPHSERSTGFGPGSTISGSENTTVITSTGWTPVGPANGAVKGEDVAQERPVEFSKSRQAYRPPLSSRDTESSTLSSPLTPISTPSLTLPLPQPQSQPQMSHHSNFRQEEDLGYIEPEEIVPPSYNPQWEEDARRREGVRNRSLPRVPQ